MSLSETFRKIIIERAFSLCEYCLIHAEDTFFTQQVDHIISMKHGGKTELDNLAQTCIYCNRNKGSDVGTILLPQLSFVRFYNPRIDKWQEHFDIDDNGQIIALTEIGAATIKILAVNHVDRILERKALIDIARYPHPDTKLYFQNQ